LAPVLIETLQRVPERLAAAATAKTEGALAGRAELSHELQRWLGDFDEAARNASDGNA
jgi:hypothetical protein